MRRLPTELLEEILIRVPPGDPGCLFRAILVCKLWCGILTTGPHFRRHYREFHKTPPLLGFFQNDGTVGCWFSPLSPTSPFPMAHPGWRTLLVDDARHGLVLLSSAVFHGRGSLVVWGPVARCLWELSRPVFSNSPSVVAESTTVLCAVPGCKHLDCHGGFLVVYVAFTATGGANASVYSSEDRAWSAMASCGESDLHVAAGRPTRSALVGRTLYLLCSERKILRYDLFSLELSILEWPEEYEWVEGSCHTLVTMEDGGLGFASLRKSRHELWSMVEADDGLNGTMKWALHRVVELVDLPPSVCDQVISFSYVAGVIFVRTNFGIFTVELSSGKVKMVSRSSAEVIPFTSFYTPELPVGLMLPPIMASSSENVEAAHNEHHDLLLQQPNMEASEYEGAEGRWMEYAEEEEEEEDEEEDEGGWIEYTEEVEYERRDNVVEQADQLLYMGSDAIVDRNFIDGIEFLDRALKIRVAHCGRLSPMCVNTYYQYGRAFLCKFHSKIIPPSVERVHIENIMSSHDLDLAWRMLRTASAILETENPASSTIEKLETFSALAEVSMLREDIDYSLRVCFKALAISKHLIEPDVYQIIRLNVVISSNFKLASKTAKAILYCAKAISVCKSFIQTLKNAKDAQLARKGENASYSDRLEKSDLDEEIMFCTTAILPVLEKKHEDLEQGISTPMSTASSEQNMIGCAVPRAASSSWSHIFLPRNS